MLLVLLVGFAFVLLVVPASAENFLVIVADDLGVDGIGAYSRDDLYGHPGEGASPGPTPQIDQIAAEGILFRSAYANPQCSPTRAATLTGRHGFRTGIGTPGGAFLDPTALTIAELLESTHEAAAVGKWHIGASDIDHPIDSGFDTYAGPLANVSDYESWSKTTNSTTTAGSTQPGYSTYVTTDNADEAIARITELADVPWFVWLAFTAPHGPLHVPPASLTTIAVDANSDNPTRFKAAVEAMDSEIARVLASIPTSVLEDTTIIFLGDNGTARNATELPFVSNHGKGTLYEGGINVPFIVQSPHIDPADEGRESLALVNTTDVFATLAELAGAASLAEDSVSLVPHLADPQLGSQRRCAYAERFVPNGGGPYTEQERAARDDRYKLIWRDGVYQEFFDLSMDPFEQQNLLPFSGLAPEAAASYTRLAQAMENGTCALPASQPVPSLAPGLAGLLAAALAAIGGVFARRRGVFSRRIREKRESA